MKYTKEEYLELFRQMTYSRSFYEKLIARAMTGEISGFVHPGLGQEALTAALYSELTEDDWVFPHHRNLPISGLRGGTDKAMCEFVGAKGGFNGGYAGDMHYSDKETKLGFFSGQLGILETMGVGVALQMKLDKQPGCVVIGCGDGTLNEGIVSEALNMIAMWKLPVLWYVVNNGLSIASKPEDMTGLKELSERATGFGIPSATYDGNDVFSVREVFHEAMEKARAGQPNLIEFRVSRWTGHFIGDPHEMYRDMDELKYDMVNRDPIKMNRTFLVENGIATDEELDAIVKAEADKIEAAVANALKAPRKTAEEVCDVSKMYA